MYNWVPQRGEDNQDGTFLCSVTFEERDLHRLSSGRYKLLYFSAVHNHAVGYSDEVEVSDPTLWVRSFGLISDFANRGLFFFCRSEAILLSGCSWVIRDSFLNLDLSS